MTTIIGYLDHAGPGYISGWLMDTEDPRMRRTVVLRQAGKIIAEVVADRYRADLESHGIGDAHYAFELAFSKPLVGELEVVEKVTGTPLAGSPLQFEDGTPNSALHRVLLVDITDLLQFVAAYGTISGIQRVQIGALDAMLNDRLCPDYSIKAVLHDDASGTFREVPVGAFYDFIKRLQVTSPAAILSVQERIRTYYADLSILPRLAMEEIFQTTLLMTGAAWGSENYFQSVQRLRRRGVNFVAMIHDLVPYVLPEFSKAATVDAFCMFLERVVRYADHIVAVSEHTRQDLEAYCGRNGLNCPSTTVSGNAHAVFTVDEDQEPPLRRPYVLCVSTIEPRKNQRFVLWLWERLVARLGNEAPTLVFVGSVGWHAERFVDDLRKTKALMDRVLFLGNVPDSTLASLYRNCAFTIYPSLYEGWGLPVGESLGFGKVCLASHASAIPEAGGNFAVYFDPTSLDDAVQKATRLITDHAWRTSLESAIIADFRPNTWRDVARKIVAAIDSSGDIEIVREVPTLTVGEYSFASLSPLDEETAAMAAVADAAAIDGSEVRQTPCSADHMIAEECFSDGVSFRPERWGRWGHRDGNRLTFRIPDPATAYLVLLSVRVQSTPAIVEVSSYRGIEKTCSLLQSDAVICIDVRRFINDDTVSIGLRLRSCSANGAPAELRPVGVGFRSLTLIENNIDQRIEALEKRAYL